MEKDIKFRKLPPVWFIDIINSFRTALLKMNRAMFPSNVVLYEFFQYFWLLPCLRVAAELDIAGRLNKRPMTTEELSAETNTDPEYLYRVLRGLASQQIFREGKDKTFSNTRLSKALIDGPDSLRYMIMQHLGTLNWGSFNDIGYSVQHGRDAFMKIHGMPIYDYLSKHPHESELFDRSMTNLTQLSVDPILNAYNFSGIKLLADIGGGEGMLLSSIIKKHRGLRGILFDLPEGMKGAPEMLSKYGVEDRIELRAGDFFTGIPIADGYMLKHILHNWSDHDASRILKMIREVIPANGKLLIVEMIINEGNAPSFGKLVDIQMMVFMQSGRERTLKEYESLLKQSDLKIKKIIPTIAPFSIIEAIPEQ